VALATLRALICLNKSLVKELNVGFLGTKERKVEGSPRLLFAKHVIR
jgi:hypothetical protein